VRCQYSAACREPHGAHHLPGVRNLQLENFHLAERTVLEAVHPAGLVYQANVFVGGGSGLHKIFCRSDARGKQPVMNEPVFLRWKDMISEVQIVAGMID